VIPLVNFRIGRSRSSLWSETHAGSGFRQGQVHLVGVFDLLEHCFESGVARPRKTRSRTRVRDYRNRAILKFFLYSGARLSTACPLKVSDFHEDGDEATIRLHEKGDKRRTIGLHFQAAQAIAEYIEKAALTSGPRFRPRLNSRREKLGNSAMSSWTLWRAVEGYLTQLPGSVKRHSYETARPRVSVFTPHSLRATTATLLLDAGVDIVKVKELLGDRHITTTQIYEKRRRSTSESARIIHPGPFRDY
jgi:integrase/recombinase XerD